MSVPLISLADQNEIPQIGLGLWQVKDENEFKTAFDSAIEFGYRHFDTAQFYRNEQMLGNSWKNSGLKREELYITTKIAFTNFGQNQVHESFKESLEKLQTDYVDLLLLHFPVPVLRKKAWLALEEIQKAGGAKSIGVSNYTIKHLEEMNSYKNTKPVINQVELHVFLQQPELIAYCSKNNIQAEAYSPLARAHVMDNAVVTKIAQKYNKTYAQIMLRFLIDQGLVIIPKSVTPSRIKENIDIFDFQLDAEDLSKLKSQDQNKHFLWSGTRIP